MTDVRVLNKYWRFDAIIEIKRIKIGAARTGGEIYSVDPIKTECGIDLCFHSKNAACLLFMAPL